MSHYEVPFLLWNDRTWKGRFVAKSAFSAYAKYNVVNKTSWSHKVNNARGCTNYKNKKIPRKIPMYMHYKMKNIDFFGFSHIIYPD